MGHQRLGKLPAHRLLPEIVRYLVAGGTPTEDLGMADMAPATLSDVLVSYDRAIEKVQRRLHTGATDLGEIARRAGQ